MTVTLTFEWTTLIFVVAAAGIAWLHASTHELRQQNKFMEKWLDMYGQTNDVEAAAEQRDLP